MEHDNVAKIVFDLLKVYNYHLVNKKELQDAYGGKVQIVGLTDFETKNIYVLKTQNYFDLEQTIAHEFVHAYLHGLYLNSTNNEDYVERTASKWRCLINKK